jgi:hypothetical protein
MEAQAQEQQERAKRSIVLLGSQSGNPSGDLKTTFLFCVGEIYLMGRWPAGRTLEEFQKHKLIHCCILDYT